MKIKGKQITPLWFGVAGLVLVGIGFGVYKLITNASNDNPGLPRSFGSSSSPTSSRKSGLCQHTDYPIRLGSCGEYVKPLQRHINSLIKPPLVGLVVDGKFGPITQREAQKHLGKNEFSKSYMSTIMA